MYCVHVYMILHWFLKNFILLMNLHKLYDMFYTLYNKNLITNYCRLTNQTTCFNFLCNIIDSLALTPTLSVVATSLFPGK